MGRFFSVLDRPRRCRMGFMGKDCGEAATFFRFQKSLLFVRLSLLVEAGVSVFQVRAGKPSLRPDGVLVGLFALPA